ncbi:MAG: hypothetical protein R3236_00250 [Phycisphaeraceae bacterium]|nr:hypothetical protein [Phycisphaeraceae bacterium]
MNGIDPIANASAPAPRTPAQPAVPTSDGGFDAALKKAAGREAGRLRQVTAQFVSTAFLMPMLKQVREDPFQTPMFHGGQGEKVFGARLDQILADRIAGSANFGLTDRLFEHLSGQLNLGAESQRHG